MSDKPFNFPGPVVANPHTMADPLSVGSRTSMLSRPEAERIHPRLPRRVHPLLAPVFIIVFCVGSIMVSSFLVVRNTSRSACIQRAAAHAQVDMTAGAAVIGANGSVDNAAWKRAVEIDQARIDAC